VRTYALAPRSIQDGFSVVVESPGVTEAPVHLPGTDELLFADVVGGGVWAYGTSGVVTCRVPRRRGIGGVAPNLDGRLLVTGKTVALAGESSSTSVLEPAAVGCTPPLIGFNDICADPNGGAFVGGLAFAPLDDSHDHDLAGAVVHLAPNGAVTVALTDVLLPNGMAFDDTRGRLYVVDSGRRVILVTHPATGGRLEVENEWSDDADGRPDGVAVAEDGTVWVARAEAGLVDALDPDGELIGRWEVPGGMAATSVGFIDDILFVTGGALPPTEGGGRVWAARVWHRGLPRHRARLGFNEPAS
jgi:sugar lactone lactonase YvrE